MCFRIKQTSLLKKIRLFYTSTYANQTRFHVKRFARTYFETKAKATWKLPIDSQTQCQALTTQNNLDRGYSGFMLVHSL